MSYTKDDLNFLKEYLKKEIGPGSIAGTHIPFFDFTMKNAPYKMRSENVCTEDGDEEGPTIGTYPNVAT